MINPLNGVLPIALGHFVAHGSRHGVRRDGALIAFCRLFVKFRFGLCEDVRVLIQVNSCGRDYLCRAQKALMRDGCVAARNMLP